MEDKKKNNEKIIFKLGKVYGSFTKRIEMQKSEHFF